MGAGTRRSTVVATAALALVFAAGVSHAPVAAQSSDQKVEEVFKNIKALNGQRADMLNPTMVLFEAALGVGCPYCHDNDGNKRELDSKPQKLIARQMIEMVTMLKDKTAGNLTPDEDDFLSTHLGELKLAFVQRTKSLT